MAEGLLRADATLGGHLLNTQAGGISKTDRALMEADKLSRICSHLRQLRRNHPATSRNSAIQDLKDLLTSKGACSNASVSSGASTHTPVRSNTLASSIESSFDASDASPEPPSAKRCRQLRLDTLFPQACDASESAGDQCPTMVLLGLEPGIDHSDPTPVPIPGLASDMDILQTTLNVLGLSALEESPRDGPCMPSYAWQLQSSLQTTPINPRLQLKVKGAKKQDIKKKVRKGKGKNKGIKGKASFGKPTRRRIRSKGPGPAGGCMPAGGMPAGGEMPAGGGGMPAGGEMPATYESWASGITMIDMLPKTIPKGRLSFTLKSGTTGAVVEVQWKKALAFYIKKVADGMPMPSSKLRKWSAHADLPAAWEAVKKEICF
jgi:hypothetical protein